MPLMAKKANKPWGALQGAWTVGRGRISSILLFHGEATSGAPACPSLRPTQMKSRTILWMSGEWHIAHSLVTRLLMGYYEYKFLQKVNKVHFQNPFEE